QSARRRHQGSAGCMLGAVYGLIDPSYDALRERNDMRAITTTLAALGLGALFSTAASADDLQQQWLDMIGSGDAYSADTLMPLYRQLEPVNTDFMIGTWKGGKFDGGQEPDTINWYGKRFTSLTDVEPLLVKIGRASWRDRVETLVGAQA